MLRSDLHGEFSFAAPPAPASLVFESDRVELQSLVFMSGCGRVAMLFPGRMICQTVALCWPDCVSTF